MDDLADAIQDAAYIGAMCTNVPQPVEPLTLPSVAEARAFMERQDAGMGSFESVLAEPLGWYLFKKYLRTDTHSTGAACLEFIEDVTAFASIGRPGLRLARAVDIIHTYFRRRVDALLSSVPSEDDGGHGTPGPAASAQVGGSIASFAPQGHVTVSAMSADEAAAADANLAGPRPAGRHTVSPSAIYPTSAVPSTSMHLTPSTVTAVSGSPLYLPATRADDLRGSGGTVATAPPPSRACCASAATAPLPPSPWMPGAKQDVLFRPGSRPHAAIAARRDADQLARASTLYEQYRDARAVLHVSGRLADTIVQLVQDHVLAKHTDGGTMLYEAHVLVAAGDGSAPRDGRRAGSPAVVPAGAPLPPHVDMGLPRTLFDTLRDVVFEGVRQRHWLSFVESSATFVRYLQFKTMESRPATAADFSLFRVLGRGGFGVVHGCKKNNTGRLYAMKAMNKRRIKAKSATDLCWNERIVLGKDSPFVISLKYAFQTTEDLYLILDLATGGDLAYHLAKEVRFTEERARFYAAQILLGLEHLHSLQIVYRDLKPENILLDEHGNARISDMGLATHVTPSLCGRCGTRGYWAPEMLVKHEGKRQTYGLAVDWWSFGCLLYEFLSGKCPFRTEAARNLDPDKHKSMDKATLHLAVPYDERYFSPAARALLQGLLERDPNRRLGSRGAFEIKSHPFFDPIDWGLLEAGLLPAPWVPETSINAAAQDMIGAFDDSTKKVTLDDDDQARFAGWEVTNKYAFQQEMVDFLTYEDVRGPVEPLRTGEECCSIQ